MTIKAMIQNVITRPIGFSRPSAGTTARINADELRCSEEYLRNSTMSQMCQSRTKKGQCTGGIVANGQGLARALARVLAT